MISNVSVLRFFVLLYFLTSIDLFGQASYKGKYNFNGIEGVGDFSYKLKENNRAILDGPFLFSSIRIDSLDKRRLYKLKITGTYSSNKKEEKWTYEDETHLVKINDVKDFSALISLESNNKVLSATYKNNLPHGSWSLRENIFREENLRAKSRSYNLRFSEGDILGEFKFEEYQGDDIIQVSGETLENGVMDGNWEFNYLFGGKLIKESRRYENGFLIGLNKVEAESGLILEEVIYFNTINKLNDIAEGKEVSYQISDNLFGLIFNDGFRDLSTEYSGQEQGNKVLEGFLIKILAYDTLFVNQQSEMIKYPLHTKRFKYDISEEELNDIEALKKEFDKLENDVKVLASRNALAINRFRKDSLSFAYEFFQYNVGKLKAFKKVVDIFSSEDIYYIDQSIFSREGFSFLTSVDTITYEFEEKQFFKEVEYSSLADKNKNLIELFRSYLMEKQNKVNEVGAYIMKELAQIRQSEELESVENEILGIKTRIDSLYNSFYSDDISINLVVNEIKKNILISEFNDLNEKYSQTSIYEERFATGLEIIELLEVAESTILEIPKFVNAWSGVRELYTEVTLDPFTFNPTFRVLRKRRIVEAGERVYNSYLENLRNEETYSNIKDHLLDIENLLFKMKELREGNTNKLERRLSTESDISQIKKILGL
jgi:hypothetical protein